jgi:hypothetical protein
VPAVRQKLHLSSCADFRGQLSPRVCVADSKQHIRAFLAEALEGLRFITCECGRANDLVAVLDNHLPDLVVLGMSAGGVAAGEMLKVLAAKAFSGKVLLLGPGGSPVVEALCKMGEELGVASYLHSPRRSASGDCVPASRHSWAVETPRSPLVDATDAVRAGPSCGYHPKIDMRTLPRHEAEGLTPTRGRN